MKKTCRLLSIFVILIACLAVPVLAGTKYTDGAPDLTAYISGTNEFSPGGDIQIPVVIVNNGISTNKEVAPSIIDRADFPTTAKFVTLTLSAGDAPVIIKSDPQMIGDLPSQARTIAIFNAKVNPDAPAGTYSVPLSINYTRFDSVTQYGVDTSRYYYEQDNVIVTVPLAIKTAVIPEIVSASSENVRVGADGYLNLTVKNIGTLDGTKTTVKIIRNGNSPITPVDSSVYVGDFPAGSTVSCQYKIRVAKAAQNISYPVDVVVVYQNAEGDYITSPKETIGVTVRDQVDFVILSPPAELNPGDTKTIRVEYKNIGPSTVRSVQARISTTRPFTSTSTVAYLGDMTPGQSVIASFELSVAKDAIIKEYGLDSELRYRDEMNTTYISDPLKVQINVRSASINTLMVIGIVILAVLIVAGIMYRRKKAI